VRQHRAPGRVRAVVRTHHDELGRRFLVAERPARIADLALLVVRGYEGDHEPPAGRPARPRRTASASASACGSEDAAAASCAKAVLPGASDDSTAPSNDPDKRPNRRGRSDARQSADKCQRFSINESFRFEAPHRPNRWPMTVPQPDSLRIYLGAVLVLLNRGAVSAGDTSHNANLNAAC
jgi:hypothetical protein